MKEEIATRRTSKGFAYEITVDEQHVQTGDYIFDFVSNNLGVSCVFQCDDSLAVLINKELQKPLAERRCAKIIASNDPVLNVNSIPGL